MAQERPPEAGPVLLVLWEAVMQGRVRPRPEVRKLLWHLVERWHELVHSQGHPKVPASTNQLEGWFGRFKPRARLTRGLKTEVGPSTTINEIETVPCLECTNFHRIPVLGSNVYEHQLPGDGSRHERWPGQFHGGRSVG